MRYLTRTYLYHFAVALIAFFPCFATAQPDFWQQTNGPYGGFVQALIVAPDSSILAGTNGGIFRSTDSGESWDSVLPEFYHSNSYYVCDFAITSTGDILAGTGAGVYRSSNNGESWTEIVFGSQPSTYVETFAISPDGGLYAGAYFEGIFRSEDGGQTWMQTDSSIYSTIRLAINSQRHIFAAIKGTRLYRSIDGGENWDEINIGHGTPSEIVINDRGHIFVSFWREGIIRSRDNGETWEEINEGFSRESSPGNQFDIDQIFTLAIDPENHLLAGSYGGGIFHSTDNGESWIPMNSGLFDLGVQAFTFTDEGDIIAGSAGSGVFRSMDHGASWIHFADGMIETTVEALTENSGGYVFAATNNSGIFRSTDKGESWELLDAQTTNFSFKAIHADDEGNLFAGTRDGRILRRRNNDTTWAVVKDDLKNFPPTSFASNAAGHIYVGAGRGIFRSSNKGVTWDQVNTTQSVKTLTININGHIFAGTFRDGILRSRNNGLTWQAMNNGLENLEDSDFDYYIIFGLATKSPNMVFAATDDGVYRSIDNGRTWLEANNGLEEYARAASITIDNEGKVYVLSSGNVYVSEDNGDHWIALESGLENVPAVAITSSKGGVLFVGTQDNGVFRSGAPTIAESSPIPTLFSLAQNYPNPFNASTTLQFQLRSDMFVTLKIYSLMGEEVAELVSEKLSAAIHRITWETGEQPSGIYVARLQGDGRVESKKLILLK